MRSVSKTNPAVEMDVGLALCPWNLGWDNLGTQHNQVRGYHPDWNAHFVGREATLIMKKSNAVEFSLRGALQSSNLANESAAYSGSRTPQRYDASIHDVVAHILSLVVPWNASVRMVDCGETFMNIPRQVHSTTINAISGSAIEPWSRCVHNTGTQRRN